MKLQILICRTLTGNGVKETSTSSNNYIEVNIYIGSFYYMPVYHSILVTVAQPYTEVHLAEHI